MNDHISKDFNRDVYCLLGIPVDNLTVESTKKRFRSKTERNEATVWSTINVNWVVQSSRSLEFRKAIINSDIITLDGRPLLWISKLLGYPMTEVVAGSSTTQELHEDKKTKQKLSIFFFGGEEGVGTLAMERINSSPSGLTAVGALNPGFGTVEEMSSDAVIDEINRVQPDILLVALGANKGTAWIEHNRKHLHVGITSHLGATINFLAGTVRRAPKFFRVTGMEWAWRIIQEPKLFTRYATDGFVMLRLVVGRFLLWRQFLSWQKQYIREQPDKRIIQQDLANEIVLSFGRNLQVTKNFPVRQVFISCVRSCKDITLDFQKTEFVDGSFMGLLLLLEKHQHKHGKKLVFINVNSRLDSLFGLFSVHGLLNMKEK